MLKDILQVRKLLQCGLRAFLGKSRHFVSKLCQYKNFAIMLLAFFLASCDTNIQCIEADEWGQQVKYTISADNNSNYQTQSDHIDVGGWNPLGYALTGQPIIAVVNNDVALAGKQKCNVVASECQRGNGSYCYSNTWSAWFGNSQRSGPNNGWEIAQEVGLCDFQDSSASNPWCTEDANCYAGYDVPVTTVPCLFYGGLGLFGAVSDNYKSSLNATNPFGDSKVCAAQKSSGCSTNMSNCFVHVGDNVKAPPFYDNYCEASGFVLNPPDGCRNGDAQCGFNLKISDRHYADNTGGYTLTFKQGLVGTNCGPLSKFTQYMGSILCNSTSVLYKQIVENTSFISYIKVLLVMYVIFSGLSFVMGFSEITHHDFIIRILKIGLIFQIISPSSWTFFNDYFFTFFKNGVGELTGILFGQGDQAVNTCGSSSPCAINISGIQAFDQAIAQLFSYDTTRKIMTLMVWKIYGFIYVGVIYILILITVYVIVKAIIFFLVSYLAISILIILAPLFIPFLLFEFTRSFFDNWLKQLISYFIQPLIVLTFAFFMVTMLMSQLQFLFGYRSCWKEWFEIPVLDISFYAWQSDYNGEMACVNTPNSIYSVDQNGNMVLEAVPGKNSCGAAGYSVDGTCDPYVCMQNRYIGYPYLDPNIDTDISRINELQNGDLLSFSDLIIFMVMIWFMVKFNDFVPHLARKLGGGGVGVAVEGASSGVVSGLTKLSGNASYQLLNPAYKFATGGRDLKEDAKSIRRTVLMEKLSDEEIKLKDKKDAYNKLLAEVRNTVNDESMPLEQKQQKIQELKKLKNEMEDAEIKVSNQKKDPNYKADNIFNRSAAMGSAITGKLDTLGNSPLSSIKGGVAKVGKYTVGTPLRFAKGAGQAVGGKVMNAVKSVKGSGKQARRGAPPNTQNSASQSDSSNSGSDSDSQDSNDS